MFARVILAFFLFSTAALIPAQVAPQLSRVYGESDAEIPTPVHTRKTTSDSAALQDILSFVSASGVKGFLGFTGQGTITFNGDPVAYQAKLYILGSDKYRLDVSRPSGLESTIVNGLSAVSQTADGQRSTLSTDIATAGFLAYPKLLSPTYPIATTIVTDRGSVVVGGVTLKRISLDDTPDVAGSPWKVSDLYFDPGTGYLMRSTSFLRLSTSDAGFYMAATVYADYRDIAGGKVPFRYVRSINGDPVWTLQLSNVDLTATPGPTLFSY